MEKHKVKYNRKAQVVEVTEICRFDPHLHTVITELLVYNRTPLNTTMV
jgi:hypothetical protein